MDRKKRIPFDVQRQQEEDLDNERKKKTTSSGGKKTVKETESTEKSRVSIVTWNLAGIGKIGNVWDFLNGFDVILLQETWVEPKNEKKVLDRLDNNYIWKAKAAQRLNKKGRAKGGFW